jgi:hypothetical protein
LLVSAESASAKRRAPRSISATGRDRIKWALCERSQLRSGNRLEEFRAIYNFDELVVDYTTGERNALLRVATSVAWVPEITPTVVEQVVRDVVNARSDIVVREMMESIEQETEFVQGSHLETGSGIRTRAHRCASNHDADLRLG